MSDVIVSRALGEDPACRQVEDRLIAALRSRKLTSLLLPHLYHLPENDSLWEELRQASPPLAIISWLEPRALAALLARHGVTAESCIHMERALPLETWVPASAASAVTQDSAEVGRAELSDPQARWYPVLDKSRCQECRHCFDFCLFGVYEIIDGRVCVAHPERCKPGCPACARICATSAIMFPLYYRDPAISGAVGHFVEVTEEAKALYQKRTGRALEPQPRPTPPPSPLADELDDLVKDLETFTKGRKS